MFDQHPADWELLECCWLSPPSAYLKAVDEKEENAGEGCQQQKLFWWCDGFGHSFGGGGSGIVVIRYQHRHLVRFHGLHFMRIESNKVVECGALGAVVETVEPTCSWFLSTISKVSPVGWSALVSSTNSRLTTRVSMINTGTCHVERSRKHVEWWLFCQSTVSELPVRGPWWERRTGRGTSCGPSRAM